MTTSPPPPPTADALAELMRLHGDDAKHKIDEQFGGLDGLCKLLGTDERQGLPNEAAVNERREKYGPNSIPTAASKSLWRLIWEATQDLTLFILIIAAIVSLVLTLVSPSAEPDDDDDSNKKKKEEGGNVEWIESVAIMISVVLVVMVKALNDWSKEKQFRALQSKLDTDQRVTVVRAGEHVELPIAELVVGDIVQVQYGATLPADGLVLQGNDLKVDESSLTGESDQIRKGHDSDPVLLSGTNVMEGRGTMLVTAVGLHSQTGMIFQLLGAADPGDKGSEKKNKGKNIHQNVHSPGRATNGTVYGASAETIVDHRQDFGSKAGGQMFGRPPAADNAVSQNIDGSVSLQQLNTRSEMSLADVDEEEEQSVTKALDDDVDEEENAKGKHQSVLQAKLTKLTVQIGKLGTLAALACVIVLIVKFCIRTYAVEKKPFRTSHLSQFVKFLIIGVTVLVVAVPEGLPLAVTLSLAFSVRKMMKDNNLVRHIDACETMGNATTICCDKTGTLTTNRMTTVQFFCANQYMEQIPYNERLPTPVVELLTESIAINTNYTTRVIPPQPGEREPTQVGNKTECALLGFVTALGVDYQQLRAAQPNNKFVKVFTFHSGRKAMGTLIKPNENEDVVRVHVKGASERVVGWCKFVLDEQGQPKPFSEADQKWLISNVIEKMANNGLRTIGIAYKDVHAQSGQYPVNEETLDPNEKSYDVDKDGKQVQVNSWIESEQKVFGNLTLLGVAGIEDPVREEVPEAIAKCQRAGITVRMLTGDNINTARSIAYKCGIVKPNDDAVILEGPDFNQRVRDSSGQVRQQLLDGIWPRLRVMARSQPQDKYTLVKGIIDSKLSEQREVVAVTGDGTNDGPALKVADVGFAMGITGTDVAKEASDIIITDDNFTSIVKAVMWGRNVYDSIAKFIQFQLTVNIVAVAVALISACAIDDTPLKAVQMLWVNLIMDTFASLALATEPPNEDLLKRKPYGRNQQLISMTMLVNIVGQSIYQLTVIMLLLYLGPQVFGFDSVVNTPQAEDPSVHFTMIYNTFVLMTLAFEIYARKVHGERNFLAGIWRNPFFIGIWILQLVVQVATVEIGGFVGVAMQTTRLPLYLWGWSAVIAVCALVWQELIVTVARCLPKSWAVGDRHVDVDRDPTVRNVFKSGARIDDKEVAETFDRVSSVAVTYMISLARLQSQISVEPRLRPTRPSQLSDNVRRRYVRQLTESRATRIRSDSSSDVYRSTGSRPDSIATDGTVFTRSMTVGDSVTNMSPQPSPSPVR